MSQQGSGISANPKGEIYPQNLLGPKGKDSASPFHFSSLDSDLVLITLSNVPINTDTLCAVELMEHQQGYRCDSAED